jgi:hypothetical protein
VRGGQRLGSILLWRAVRVRTDYASSYDFLVDAAMHAMRMHSGLGCVGLYAYYACRGPQEQAQSYQNTVALGRIDNALGYAVLR